MQQEPLGNRPVDGKTSLAGVQDKIVLARGNGTWLRVFDGYPSTHILKPTQADRPTMIHDEEYGLRLARSAGVSTFASWVEEFDGVEALVIERYDRRGCRRLHQEDLAQALGIGGNEKYQRVGGRASFARIASVLTEHADRDSLERLARMVTYAVAIGNLDLHAKNLSLLHAADGAITLAPGYDLVPMVHQPEDGELALAVNGTYRHASITRQDLVEEVRSWGVRSSSTLVDLTLQQVRVCVGSEVPPPRAHPGLASVIARFVDNLLAGRAVGS
ncbi:type II toxin-antitoxin system HipA family toxin [Propionibacteriaceae bacterium Y2011]|uniref:type II toxin-antitoxin system HipA family toxin n=1 Tax=Microlunatus sp. Y2014 TaxID=3418488 RepID=UPI003B44C2AA